MQLNSIAYACFTQDPAPTQRREESRRTYSAMALTMIDILSYIFTFTYLCPLTLNLLLK